jgi:D-alanyl-D-alanine carboxypeptidase
MKQFFYLVFGGLLAILIGVGIAYGGGLAWRIITTKFPNINFSSISAMANAVISQPIDGTSIAGLKRKVLYTASEEEDLISTATLSMNANSPVTADAYIVEKLSDKSVTSQSNANRLMPSASLTKLVTAVVAKRKISSNDHITISRDIVSTYGNTGLFKMGETFRADDLFYPLLMVSSNDAAEALARDFGRARFIAAMNDFAQEIGAYRTHFSDPSGLSPDNVSTAHDVAIILDWIRINNPEILSITQLKAKTVPGHTWINPTHFLSWSNYLGGKNGYTEEANRTGAALFSLGQDKNVYAVVVLGSNSRDADVIKLLGKVVE